MHRAFVRKKRTKWFFANCRGFALNFRPISASAGGASKMFRCLLLANSIMTSSFQIPGRGCKWTPLHLLLAHVLCWWLMQNTAWLTERGARDWRSGDRVSLPGLYSQQRVAFPISMPIQLYPQKLNHNFFSFSICRLFASKYHAHQWSKVNLNLHWLGCTTSKSEKSLLKWTRSYLTVFSCPKYTVNLVRKQWFELHVHVINAHFTAN